MSLRVPTTSSEQRRGSSGGGSGGAGEHNKRGGGSSTSSHNNKFHHGNERGGGERGGERGGGGGGGSSRAGGGGGMMDLDDRHHQPPHRRSSGSNTAAQQQSDDHNVSDHDEDDEDDDNNNILSLQQQTEGDAVTTEKEDPLLLAIDDLEGRVVSAIDDIKSHPGMVLQVPEQGGDSTSSSSRLHMELAAILHPVLEVAAHTAPSVARTYYHGVGHEGIESSVEGVYERVVSDLVLPVMLEMAQSEENSPAKRTASLEFFRTLYKECHKAGSWLDSTSTGLQAGPYGAGGALTTSTTSTTTGTTSTTSTSTTTAITPAQRVLMKRRQMKRLTREGEILRYWVQASIACTTITTTTTTTNAALQEALAQEMARATIAAAASIRPSLRHIAQRIKDADDRGANRLYGPLMKMMEGILKKLFLGTNSVEDEWIRSASVKFLEIVILCCSQKSQQQQQQQQQQDPTARRRGQGTGEDFSLDELPEGHPIITREALESIAEYGFSTLRGLTMMGGQLKLDVNVLSDMMLTGGAGNIPSEQVVSILKPTALAYLEVESSLRLQTSSSSTTTSGNEDATSHKDLMSIEWDPANYDFEFPLSQKSYTVAINAMSALALSRPVFFRESALCLARRTIKPPVAATDGIGHLTHSAVLAITSQLRASCLTLLRNPLSVTTNTYQDLHNALKAVDMEIQADKALSMARQATALKSAGRAARNRANMYYEWDASESDRRVSKRQRETDDALAKMRAAKAARGLGHGIQLPTSMAEAIELTLLNLPHLPNKRPPVGASTKPRRVPITLDYVIDAIISNGASLSQEEGHWYERDGGAAWSVELASGTTTTLSFQLATSLLETIDSLQASSEGKLDETGGEAVADDERVQKRDRVFLDQCRLASSAALSRLLERLSVTTTTIRPVHEVGSQMAARLAFTLGKVEPSGSRQEEFLKLARASVTAMSTRLGDDPDALSSLQRFIDMYPLVSLSLAMDITQNNTQKVDPKNNGQRHHHVHTLCTLILHEALFRSLNKSSSDAAIDSDNGEYWEFDRGLELLVAVVVHVGELANQRPGDVDKKTQAGHAILNLQDELLGLPRLAPRALQLVGALCDIEEIAKKAAEAQRKTSQDSSVSSAATHAAKVAAEKRATTALLVFRDVAFYRVQPHIIRSAVDCAVAVAAGSLASVSSIQEKALKLALNVLFSRSEAMADFVVAAALAEMERASKSAIALFDSIQKANKEASVKEEAKRNPHAPQSEEEKLAMERMRKPALLFMALCVRRTHLIENLFSLSSVEKADVLSKTVRVNMSKLARAAASKHGAANIAMDVAAMAASRDTPLLLSFLENLVSVSDSGLPDEEVLDACYKIQESKLDKDGKKDPRFIIPIVSVMKRVNLIERLPEFVAADDNVFLAALVRMSDRLGRQALLFRDEPDSESPTLRGMTLCEQLVFLHKLDFAAAGLPQKRYLAAIKLCLEDDEIYSDRVVMSALDQMSGVFLTAAEKLPLAFMRTCILVCTKHESLHSWICYDLLPRLVDGKIYEDPRQWEGWMRCAFMLEKSGDPSISCSEALAKLPDEQRMQYQTKWASK